MIQGHYFIVVTRSSEQRDTNRAVV